MRTIGMISGTSADAVEAVLADFGTSNGVLTCHLLAHRSVRYPAELRHRVLSVLPPAASRVEDVCRLDVEIGQYFAAVASELVDDFAGEQVPLICSHGQTVFHWVEGRHARGTLQLGQASWIAERTGASVVSDVRARDIAAGGHGAPLVSILDTLLLAPPRGTVRAAVNIGGISNVTVLEHGCQPVAFDIGPGNALIDATIDWLTDGRTAFDEGGERARGGRVDEKLLERLLREPFYELAPPKSTGKELFNLDYVRAGVADSTVAGDDLLCTLTALTVETVGRALDTFSVTEVVPAGGGTRNRFLMEGLRRRLPRSGFVSLEDFGVPEQAKEALAFALIGYLTASGLPSSVPSCTGARHATVLGSITPGRSPLASVGTATMPERVVVHDMREGVDLP